MDNGCPYDPGREKETLNFTLVDHMDTSEEILSAVGHTKGAYCSCSECRKLKILEDKFILKIGSLYSQGLNTRDEIQRKTRGGGGM